MSGVDFMGRCTRCGKVVDSTAGCDCERAPVLTVGTSNVVTKDTLLQGINLSLANGYAREQEENAALRSEVARLTKEREEWMATIRKVASGEDVTEVARLREQVKAAQVPEYLCQGPRCPEVARLTKELERERDGLKIEERCADELRNSVMGEVARLREQSSAQLAELNSIAEALGTWEGHSSVDHINRLRDSLGARDRLIGELMNTLGLAEYWADGCGNGKRPCRGMHEYTASKEAAWEALKGNAPGETGKGSERG